MIKKFHFSRFEFKYYLNNCQHKKILDRLLTFMKWDEFASRSKENCYLVNSLYFDSPNLLSFKANQSGISDRFKLRLRIYGDFKEDKINIFFEIKKKKNMVVIKDRSLGFISKKEFFKFLNNHHNNRLMLKLSQVIKGLQVKGNFKQFCYLQMLNKMKPNVFITYNRQPLASLNGRKLRITFDSQISTVRAKNIIKGSGKCYLLKKGAIMELKFNGTLPYWVEDIIKDYQLERIPYSKYCQGIMKGSLKC